MKYFQTLNEENIKDRKWLAVLVTVTLSWGLILFLIYGLNDYGGALFLLTPFAIGMISTIILGYKRHITLKQSLRVGVLSLLIFSLGLLLFAIEGLICLIMVSPIALVLTWIGCGIGFAIIDNKPSQSLNSVAIVIILIPIVAIQERNIIPETRPVVTKVVINASVETVWKNVIEFPKLDEPSALLFKAGISYPIESTIEHTDKGIIRYCKFNTGEFVEPITEWKENELLAFDVESQPLPMQEISFYELDSPHLHDYFVSQKGQFKLTQINNTQVELEGTTWYYNRIKPNLYWNLWSDYIIHKIHKRVLNHIKVVSQDEISQENMVE